MHPQILGPYRMPLPSSPPSSTTALPLDAAAAFVPPHSRGARNYKFPSSPQPGSTSSLAVDEITASRDPRTGYTPPVPSSALELLRTSPPVEPSALAPSTTRSTTTSSSTGRSIQKAPPVPTAHFMFQQQTSYVRRPKTADSNASKSSLGRAFARAFGMSSSSSLRSTATHSPAASTASVQTTTTATTAASTAATSRTTMSETTKKMSALEVGKETARRAVAFVKRKLNSKTPAEQLPQTWAAYETAYGNFEIDIEDPPLPPNRIAADGEEPTPFQNRAFNPPLPKNESERQSVINRLDLFGTREKAAMNASQATLDIVTPVNPSSHAMVHTNSTASTVSCSSYLTPSEAASSRRNSSSGFSFQSTSTIATSAPASPALEQQQDAVQSLQDHPIFRALVARCRTVFEAKVGLLTVLDDEQQLFLATGGMPDGVDSVPRSASFCAHAIMNEDRGLVVLDSTASHEWRFANQLPSAHLGARFYAGVPIWARAGPNEPSVAIGTLCVLDDKPRSEFTEAHRRVLRDFATQATNAIESWTNERMTSKMARLHGSLALSKSSLAPPSPLGSPPLTPPPSAGFPSAVSHLRPKTAPGLGTPLPATPPASVHRSSVSGHSRKDSSESNASSIPSSHIVQPRRPTALSLGVTTDDPISALPREVQKQFDTAVKMLAKALELDLVYLAALDLASSSSALAFDSLSSSSSSGIKLRILSSHGLPSPPPSFDPALHLKALRAPEGGLIYKNPRFATSSFSSTVATYAGGILIPVLEVRRTGYVICGYSTSPGREFKQRDLTFFCRFAEGLEAGCIRASRTSTAVALGASHH